MTSKTTALTLATLAILGLSGCVVRYDETNDTTDNAVIADNHGSSSSQWSMSQNGCTITSETIPPQIEHPDDIDLHRSGDVAGPLDETWTWRVDNVTFQRFTVRLHFSGLQETPEYAIAEPTIDLHGGCGKHVGKKQGAETGNIDLSVGPGQVVGGEKDIIDYTGDASLFTLGDWSLHIASPNAALHYTVDVVVDY